MKFKTEIFTGGGNTAGFWIPEEVVLSFGKGKRVPVIVNINGYTFKNTVASYDGKFAIGLAMEHREKTGIKIGDKVEVELTLDDKPRIVEVPECIQKVINQNPEAKEIFEKLAYSHKKEYVRWVEEAKKEETKQSRLSKLNQTIIEKSSKSTSK